MYGCVLTSVYRIYNIYAVVISWPLAQYMNYYAAQLFNGTLRRGEVSSHCLIALRLCLLAVSTTTSTSVSFCLHMCLAALCVLFVMNKAVSLACYGFLLPRKSKENNQHFCSTHFHLGSIFALLFFLFLFLLASILNPIHHLLHFPFILAYTGKASSSFFFSFLRV